MIISDHEIKKRLGKTIIIDPYNPSNLKSSSYDLTLGEYYFREQKVERDVYNIFNEKHTQEVWGCPQRAILSTEVNRLVNGDTENIKPEDRVILIAPGETILAHTNEFVGGSKNVTTMMKARSSYGRVFIEICKCAGWGDVGYINRWTMEITNNSRYYHIPLVAGRRICQMVFLETYRVDREYTGKYQERDNIQDLRDRWIPKDMLPKLWLDRI